MSNQEKSENHSKKKKVIIIIAFVVLFIALMVCILLLLKRDEEKDPLNRGFVEEDNTDTIMDNMADKVAEGMFECKMSTSWTFDDADSVSPNAYVANVENNRHTIYFDVYEAETNELLYSSPLIPVGEELNKVKLDKKLPAGDYEAVVMYTLVDENEEEVSTVGFNITISVIN